MTYLGLGIWIAIVIVILYYTVLSLVLIANEGSIYSVTSKYRNKWFVGIPILIFILMWLCYPVILGVLLLKIIIVHHSKSFANDVNNFMESL